MAEAGDRSQRDRAGVGPDPESARARDLVPLEDMSGYAIAAGDPDIRGWSVRTQSGRDIGEIEGLLVDRDRGEVVMVEVELRDGGAHAEVPIRSVQLDREHRAVIVDSAGLGAREGGFEAKDSTRGRETLSARGDIRSDAREFTSDSSRSAASFGARGSQRADLPGLGSSPARTASAAAGAAAAGAAGAVGGTGRRQTAAEETIRRTAAEDVRESRSGSNAPNEPSSREFTERSSTGSARQSMPRSDELQRRPSPASPRNVPGPDAPPERRPSTESTRQSMPRPDESSRPSMPRSDELSKRSETRSDDITERRPSDDGQ